MPDNKPSRTQPIIPVLAILIGTTVLLGNLNFLKPDVVGIAWPIFLITAGFVKLCEGE
jgi:uncharacterized membrane protein